jgi:type VII secretion integral membrane protein EccD
LVRVSVVSEDRRLDIGVPASVPLIEVIPGFARNLGVLDPSLVHGGYAVQRADGSALDPSLSAMAQGVRDGDVLTLARGVLLVEPRVYDDVTEAVLDATAEQSAPWTPKDSARTALAVSLTLLALCAVLLLSVGAEVALASVIAGGAALVLVIASAVLGRIGQREAGHALGLSASAFAAIAGYLAVDSATLWGWPLAAAATGAMLTAGLCVVLHLKEPQIHLAPAAWGLAILLPASVTGLAPDAQVPAYVITAAVVGALANVLPWIAFSSSRIRVISPQTEQDIFADPAPIDAAAVKARAARAARTLVALRIGMGLALVTMAPVVAAANGAGAALMGLAFVGLMFQSRQTYSRAGVLVVMAIGAVGLAVTALAFGFAQPESQPWLLGVLLTATAIVIALTLISPRARIRLARVADAIEVVVLAALLPLGVIAAGWV